MQIMWVILRDFYIFYYFEGFVWVGNSYNDPMSKSLVVMLVMNEN